MLLTSAITCYQQTDVSVVYATLHMGPDGLLSSSAWSEAASVSTPTNQQFTEPEPECHNCYEGWEDDLLPEEREVPLLNLYLTTKRVEDIALRLVSLRQAFTTLLGSTLSRNHLFVAGKVLMGALVQAHHMDEAEFIRAYNDFVDYLSDPSKQIDIERELAEAKIHHVNLIDVLFELVLFGMMTAQKSLMVHPGGFMERLYALLYSFLPVAASIEPKAERYLLLLNDSCDTLPPHRGLDTNALHYFALNFTFPPEIEAGMATRDRGRDGHQRSRQGWPPEIEAGMATRDRGRDGHKRSRQGWAPEIEAGMATSSS
ncbi:uncharacterized protein LOC115132570 [Oncorhynchus nerka]|uniref:uncharacterized protein LOC115132570 n=1 Tax=Oncorhynchus nerka TaxID=8023 RepID=UPI0011311F51|nr:uncharacterized protein LOC115132570 [Oncorhynchus nerka]